MSEAEFVKYHENQEQQRATKAIVRRDPSHVLGVGLAEGTVRSVIVEKGGHTLIMAEKEFEKTEESPLERTREDLEKILRIHHELKKIGLPVIPTMRLEADPSTNQTRLITTDLSRGGACDVFSVNDWRTWKPIGAGEKMKYQERKGKYAQEEKKFFISNSGEVSKQIADMFRTCVANGVLMNGWDVPFVVVEKKTHKAAIVFGDITDVEFYNRNQNPFLLNIKMAEDHTSWKNFIDEINMHLTHDAQLTDLPLEDAMRELFHHGF